jgi:hypothetical protein
MKKNIHYHSDAAASIQTVTGWVSATGVFWDKDEHMARWSGCTHMTCDCGNVHPKGRTICDACFEKRSIERFMAMPEKADLGAFLFSDSADRYFSEISEAEDFAFDEGMTLHDLRLIICEPNIMRPVDYENWESDLPEGMGLEDCAPKEVLEKLRELNELIVKAKPILSWRPGKYRLALVQSGCALDGVIHGGRPEV